MYALTGAPLLLMPFIVILFTGHGFSQYHGAQDLGSTSAAPTAITVEVAPFEPELNPDEKYPQGTFKIGARARFRILATNVSTETIAVRVMGPYDETRPELRVDEQLVKYLDRVNVLIGRENNLANGISVTFIHLLPSETKQIGMVDLSDWYKPLSVGTYGLIVKQRFRGDWIQSPSLVFEIRE